MTKEKVYLDRNENHYGPAPKCYEIVKNAELELFSWYTKAYQRGVKSDLSEKLAAQFGLPEKQVILGYGAEDLLKQVIQSYLTHTKKLMIPSHSWWYYKEIAEEMKGTNVEFPLVEGEDSYIYDVEKMIELYEQEKPDVVFIASPNNPTGNSIKKGDLVYALEKMKDTVVVLDEAYVHDCDNNFTRGLIAEFQNLAVIRTFSKYYALAGLRIGYALIGENLTKLSELTKRYLGFNRISEAVAIAALDSED